MKKLGRLALLVIMAATLVLTSLVTACGGGGAEAENTVTFGWLGDQTGASATAFKEVMMAMNDYLAEVQNTDPIDGVKINIVTYDTRLEYGRMSIGYEWLKGQGMDVLLGYLPNTSSVVQPNLAADKIPIYSFVGYPTTLDADWVYSYMCTGELEGRAMMDYLINTWWPAQGKSGKVKIANVGNTAWDTTIQYRKGFSAVVAANPGKVEYTEVGGDVSQTAWASEVSAILNTDAIVLTNTGTSSPTFLKEALLKGYKGQIIASSNSLLGMWSLVTSLIPKTSMEGIMVPHFYPVWTDDAASVKDLEATLTAYRPSEAASLKLGTTWMSGWVTCALLVECVREAARNVGGDKVDGATISDAMQSVNLEMLGMPALTLANSGTHHVFQSQYRIIKYDAAGDEWDAFTPWSIVPGFSG